MSKVTDTIDSLKPYAKAVVGFITPAWLRSSPQCRTRLLAVRP